MWMGICEEQITVNHEICAALKIGAGTLVCFLNPRWLTL
jgi:hypothetical protein